LIFSAATSPLSLLSGACEAARSLLKKEYKKATTGSNGFFFVFASK
jgi:hypothetical protein